MMTLASLLETGQLEALKPDGRHIQRMLDTTRAFLADAGLQAISANSRFRLACNAISNAALTALRASGYRPTTAQEPERVTIPSLPITIGIEERRVKMLDRLCRKRDREIYDGTAVDEKSVRVCREEAIRLVAELEAWIRKHRPELAA